MDVAILNILDDIPLVTKIWTLGSIGLSILTSTRMIDPTKVIYNYDLVFKKGQYERIFYSIFNYGEFNWVSMLNIFISANHLTMLENSFELKRRYCWTLFLILSLIVMMSGIIQPSSSLGILLHENLVYYEIKRNTNEMNFRLLGGINIAASLIPVYMNGMMYFVYNRSLFEISMNFLPAHFIFYFDDVIQKLYDIDIFQTPYDLWLKNRR
ncbi:derlin NDAI_0C05460 [Naumovozyma dairenensis CBS 421]|uniref:Derlin n=1 Tax=Naumovozyma dairenensis (strain ATCC 10597 / BCRC 20456 / CBS 421 / NBRC 0211 / NRRL Y-12639) TaxID=1071378 RepID=G0W8U4_NAUDC|nr:hypothetical protein NDAI_0C05460 [Naumovozyma dairenensis CBS 421]CCD24205.1 hypothetical protein NDAI_0C05460 [Naumovozyma dairenensis CBS 421]